MKHKWMLVAFFVVRVQLAVGNVTTSVKVPSCRTTSDNQQSISLFKHRVSQKKSAHR